MFLSGTDEAAVIEVIAHRTIAQRQRIKEAFKQAVGKVRVLKALLGASEQNLIVNETVFQKS